MKNRLFILNKMIHLLVLLLCIDVYIHKCILSTPWMIFVLCIFIIIQLVAIIFYKYKNNSITDALKGHLKPKYLIKILGYIYTLYGNKILYRVIHNFLILSGYTSYYYWINVCIGNFPLFLHAPHISIGNLPIFFNESFIYFLRALSIIFLVYLVLDVTILFCYFLYDSEEHALFLEKHRVTFRNVKTTVILRHINQTLCLRIFAHICFGLFNPMVHLVNYLKKEEIRYKSTLKYTILWYAWQEVGEDDFKRYKEKSITQQEYETLLKQWHYVNGLLLKAMELDPLDPQNAEFFQELKKLNILFM